MNKRFILIALIFILLLSGCTTKILKESDVEAFSNTLTENVLIGLNEENYTKFSSDFNESMLKGIPEDSFINLLKQIKGKIGEYIEGSKKFNAAAKNGKYITVIYYASFAEEESVKITISFENINGEYKIAGLYFDSPKLRGQ